MNKNNLSTNLKANSKLLPYHPPPNVSEPREKRGLTKEQRRVGIAFLKLDTVSRRRMADVERKAGRDPAKAEPGRKVIFRKVLRQHKGMMKQTGMYQLGEPSVAIETLKAS